MDKERLEEIKRNVTYIYNGITNKLDCVDLAEQDFEWLIEQAERVQELERRNKFLADNHFQQTELTQRRVKKLADDKYHYKQALEDIAKEMHLAGDSHYTTQQKLIRVILNARKALESEFE